MANSMSDYLYDLRVVRLTKSVSTDVLSTFLQKKSNCYVCLGHFDMLEVVPLPQNEFPLKAIQDDIQNTFYRQDHEVTENYKYPLYILKQLGSILPSGELAETDEIQKEIDDLDQFWAVEKNFLFITRFHCDRVDDRQVSFSQELMNRCRDFQDAGDFYKGSLCMDEEVRGYVRFLTEKGNEAVSVVFYDSLELGDIVGAVKSNALSAAMKLLQHLYECPAVSDAYTYCGVDCTLLRDSKYSQIPVERREPLELSHIQHASTRFSVKFAKAADTFLNPLKAQMERVGLPARRIDFVTGTADVIVEWTPCSEVFFLYQIQSIVTFPKLYHAFLDIITRIGTEYRTPQNSREKPLEKEPFSNLVSYEPKEFSGPLERWRYPLVRLLGTLRTMYESSVMDELSQLLIPGVNAFLERICYLRDQVPWKNQDDNEISNFMDWWSALASDIYHLESQMVQRPGLTPARHYIPVMVLQFELRFVYDYTNLIRLLDETLAKEKDVSARSRAFVPILFPTLERNTHTLCPMDPGHDVHYTKKSPLCIFLPIHRLYQPWEIACMLGHEIQHYVGDVLRYRKERLHCLVKSVAAYVTVVLGMYVSDSYTFQSSTILEERQFQEKLAESIAQQLSIETSKNAYLRFIAGDLPAAMFYVASRTENQETLQNILLKHMALEKQIPCIRQLCILNTMDVGAQMASAFHNHVEYLTSLYKECFADISMILILNCNFEEYYHCIYKEEASRFGVSPASKEENQIFERHTDRLAMVLIIMEELRQGWMETKEPSDIWSCIARKKAIHWRTVREFVNEQRYTWKRFYSDDGGNGNVLLADEACQLELYLKKCGDSLLCLLKKNKDIEVSVEQLQEYLSIVRNNGFNWIKIRSYLESSHPHVTSFNSNSQSC